MPRAVLYARVSTDRQAAEGYSLPSQLEACRDYARRHGFEVAAEICDDISGSIPVGERPGGGQVYAMLGSVDAVIMFTIDRTARDKREYPLEFFVFLNDVQDAGAELHFVDSGQVSGSIVDIIGAWQAGQERRDITERTLRGKRAAVKAGNVMVFKMAPFGYRKAVVDGKKTLAIREGEADTVRTIFEWYTVGDGENGTKSMRAITQRLTELRVPTCADLRKPRGAVAKTARSRGEWERATIAQILKNETYAGTWYYQKHSDSPIPVEVPAIISRETWELAQERRARNKREARRNTKYDYLLRTMVRCPDCGCAMIARSVVSRGVRRYYYECWSRHKGRPCDHVGSYNASDVDAAAWQQICDWLTNPDRLREALGQYQQQQSEATRPLRERLETVDALIHDNRRKLERLLDVYIADAGYMRELFEERRRQYETALAAQHEERERLGRLIAHQELSESRIRDILAFANTVGAGITKADTDFSKRRQVVEMLETSGELQRGPNGEKILHLHCVLGDARMSVEGTGSRTYTHKLQEPFVLHARILLRDARDASPAFAS